MSGTRMHRACLPTLLASLLAALLALPPAGAAEAAEWREIRPGMEVRRERHQVAGLRKPVTLQVLRADPAQVEIAVFDTYSAVSTRGVKYPSYSLRDLARVTDALALINGGFGQSTYYPVPAGLVVQDGRQKSPLNKASRTQSGVFCMPAAERRTASASAGTTTGTTGQAAARPGKARIVNKSDYRPGLCRQALQSGPKIVEYDGENGISRPARAFERSAVCVDGAGRVLFVKSSRVSLFHLADILRAPEVAGGYGCQAALNLSGDVESGLLYTTDGKLQSVGEVDAPVASAIAVLPKRGG